MVADLNNEVAAPVLVFVDAPEVVRLGVQCLLDAEAHRVRVTDDRGACDVELLLGPGREPRDPVRLRPVARVELAPDFGPGSAYRSARRGVSTVLPLDVSSTELVEAVEKSLSRPQADETSLRDHQEYLAAAMGLAPREGQILSLICRGMSNDQVARSLFLSINSVKTYIRSLYRKAGVASRSQAVVWGLKHGF